MVKSIDLGSRGSRVVTSTVCATIPVSIRAIVIVKTKRQNLFLIFENGHSKLRILGYSRLENQ